MREMPPSLPIRNRKLHQHSRRESPRKGERLPRVASTWRRGHLHETVTDPQRGFGVLLVAVGRLSGLAVLRPCGYVGLLLELLRDAAAPPGYIEIGCGESAAAAAAVAGAGFDAGQLAYFLWVVRLMLIGSHQLAF